METIKLRNGVEMPVFGLGASIIPKCEFRVKFGGKIEGSEAAQRQFEMYEHCIKSYNGLMYDVSPSYGMTEQVLGAAIKHTRKRRDMFIALKISNAEQRRGDVTAAFEKHLKVLCTDYVDLLLLHWPNPDTFIQSYKVLENIYDSGRAKAIGMSNCHEHHLKALMEATSVVPMVNQIEVHPLFTNAPLRAYCESLGIKVMAYSPLGRMHDVLMKNKVLRALAAKHKNTVPQIILRWDIDSGMAAIPRTLSPKHFAEVLDVLNFSLTDEEITAIDGVNENVRLRFNPDTVDYNLV